MPCRHSSDLLGSLGGASEFSLPNPPRHYAPDLGIEPIHLDIALGFDLAGRQAVARVTTRVRARREGERKLLLDAVDLHDLELHDPDGHALDFSYDGQVLDIEWDEAIPSGEERRVEIHYRIIAPLTGMFFSWPDEKHTDRPRFVVTDHESERARYWLPCIDHPTVRTPLDLHLRAGAEYTALANGLKVGEELHEDGTRTVHWKLQQPCPSYLICLAVGDFIRVDGEEVDGIEVASFTTSNHPEDALQRTFEPTSAMLRWLTQKLESPFPFPKYFQIAVPQIGGAMENISLVTWDDRFVADAVLHEEKGSLFDQINIHEMAHSWFGDAIVVRDFSHVWLKESWASYIEICWLEDSVGTDAMHWQLAEKSRSYRKEADDQYVRPIVTRHFDSSWDMYDAHLYPGGAFRLHMLRQELGDNDFWGGVRDYVRLFTGRVVETSDFRRSLEEHSGRSLARFFDQWFGRPGYPRLRVSFRFSRSRGEGLLTIEQTQVDPKRDIETFAFPLEVDFETAAGEWTSSTVQVSAQKTTLVVPLDERPTQLLIDPRSKLLHSLEMKPNTTMLKRSLRHAPTVPGRLQAVRLLGRHGGAGSIQALRDAWTEEPFWGVRIAMARALGAAGSAAASRALAEILPLEQDPRVLESVAEACGRYREPEIAAALLERLGATPPLPYLARAAALASLGKQQDEAHIETLEQAAQDHSWWGWVRRGAMRGLGSSRSKRALTLLEQRVRYGDDSLQVRVLAILALAEAGRWQDDASRTRTLELLSDLCRDPEYGARMAAARALLHLQDSRGLQALELLEPSIALQDIPRIRRMARKLRASGEEGPPVQALRKRIEGLTKRVQKLRDRVEVLEARERVEKSD